MNYSLRYSLVFILVDIIVPSLITTAIALGDGETEGYEWLDWGAKFENTNRSDVRLTTDIYRMLGAGEGSWAGEDEGEGEGNADRDETPTPAPLEATQAVIHVGICGSGSLDPFFPAVALSTEWSRLSGVPLVNFTEYGASNNFVLKFRFRHTGSNPQTAQDIASEWMSGKSPVHAIVGCMSSETSDIMAQLGAIYKVPQISPYAGSYRFTKDRVKFAYFMRTLPVLAGIHTATLLMMCHFGWRTATFYFLDDPYVATYERDLFNEISAESDKFNVRLAGHPLPRPSGALQESCEKNGVEPSGHDSKCVDRQAWEKVLSDGVQEGNVIYIAHSTHAIGTLLSMIHAMGLTRFQWVFPVDFFKYGMNASRSAAFDGSLQVSGAAGANLPPAMFTWGNWFNTPGAMNYTNVLPLVQAQDPMLGNFMQNMNADWPEWYWPPNPRPPSLFLRNRPLLVEAILTLQLAVGRIIARGGGASMLRGESLQKEMMNMSFMGLYGSVNFTEKGDRKNLAYEVWNYQSGTLVRIGYFKEDCTLIQERLPRFVGNTTEKPSGVPPKCDQSFYFNGFECVTCPLGQECVLAEKGKCRGVAPGSSPCSPCKEGSFGKRSTEGAAICQMCDAGKLNPHVGRTECTSCANGSVQPATGQTLCIKCAPGMFSPKPGETECELCKIGSYASTPGSSDCIECSAGFGLSTEYRGATSVEKCVCLDKTYRDRNTCRQCKEGMTCSAGSDMLHYEEDMLAGFPHHSQKVYPKLMPGYFSTLEAPLSVFKCISDDRCPGGVPGTCAPGRDATSIACSSCQLGMAPSRDTGSCEKCEDVDAAPFIVAILAFLLLLGLTAVCVGRTKTVVKSFRVSISLAPILTFLQQLGIVALFKIEWKNPVKTFLFLFTVFNFDLDLVDWDCIATAPPEISYSFRVSIIAIALMIMAAIYSLAAAVRKDSEPCKIRFALLVNMEGTFMSMFFVSVVSSILAPLFCMPHPNGEQSVRNFPGVLCFAGGAHTTMLTVALLVSPVPLGFLAVSIWAARSFPAQMRSGNVVFLKAFSFLFFRFNTTCYWFMPLVLVRNMLICLSPSLGAAFGQVFLVMTIILGSLLLVAILKPWRTSHANVVDGLSHVGILMILNVSAFYVVAVDWELIGIACTVSIAVCIAIMIMVSAHNVYIRTSQRKQFQFFVCHHKAGAGCCARLFQMQLRSTKGVNRRVFIDSDDLQDLDKLFDYVSTQLEVLLALWSSELLTRPWCIGELTTTRINNIKIVTVRFPGVDMHSAEWIESYSTFVSIECLLEHGITLSMVQRTLRWFPTTKIIDLPELLTTEAMQKLCKEILENSTKSMAASLSLEKTLSSCQPTLSTSSLSSLSSHSSRSSRLVMLSDPCNLEAVASAIILHMHLAPLLAHHTNFVPCEVLGGIMEVPDTATFLIFFCTNGVFTVAPVLSAFEKCAQLKLPCLPFLADESFRFPDEKLLSSVQSVASAFTTQPRALSKAIPGIFKEIAVFFQPAHLSATEGFLKTKANESLARILRGKTNTLQMTLEKEEDDEGAKQPHETDFMEQSNSKRRQFEL